MNTADKQQILKNAVAGEIIKRQNQTADTAKVFHQGNGTLFSASGAGNGFSAIAQRKLSATYTPARQGVSKIAETKRHRKRGASKKAAAAPKESIKHFVRTQKIVEEASIRQKAAPEIVLENIGKRGVNLAVGTVFSTIKFVMKLIVKFLASMVKLLGPVGYLAMFFLLSILLAVGVLAGSEAERAYYDEMSARSEATIVASQLTTPRLTADGILTNGWYVGNVNPFVPAGFGVVRYGTEIDPATHTARTVTYYGNCTAYAWGRWGEILNYAPSLPTGNAGTWYSSNITSGAYSYGTIPKAGAIAVWKYPSGGAGHVAVVEQIYSDGTIVMSESRYNNGVRQDIDNLFYLRTFSCAEDVEALWQFQGYIYLPEDAAITE